MDFFDLDPANHRPLSPPSVADVSACAGRFDYLIIESTGISEPLPVAETFTFRDEQGTGLSDLARLDTLVTVVDAVNFPQDLETADDLAERGQSLGDGDQRTLAELLVDQVEFADVIIINRAGPEAWRTLPDPFPSWIGEDGD
jgi:G3E family GTPase